MSNYKTLQQLKHLGATSRDHGKYMMYRRDGMIHVYEKTEHPMYQPLFTVDPDCLHLNGLEAMIVDENKPN